MDDMLDYDVDTMDVSKTAGEGTEEGRGQGSFVLVVGFG